MVSLDSGLVDDHNSVTCDQAEKIGAKIQESLTGKTFASCSFTRKDQIKNIQSLYSYVTVDKEKIVIDPLTLFLRLALIVERKTDTERDDYFAYELTPYPTSLFEDGVMRFAKNKSSLKTYLLVGVKPMTIPECHCVADGGALLWSCNWKKNELFGNIYKKYIRKCKELHINTVVFDGYQMSTKDGTHRSRTGKIFQTVEVRDNNPCPSDRSEFLTNYTNKQSFVNALGEKLKEQGLEVVLCPCDADTTIVKVALEKETKAVTVLADDTDILCLLLHHVYFTYHNTNVYLKNMKINKNTEERKTYSINEVIAVLDKSTIERLLLAHAFTGSDTTSMIYNFGKTAIFSKMKKSNALAELGKKFYVENQEPEEIGKTTIRFFELLHSTKSTLQQIRKQKYDILVNTDRTKIDPALLPPSPRAAYYHGLRVYHQVQVWTKLLNSDKDPLLLGWKIVNNMFVPIMTDIEAGPPEILKVVRCGCKGNCGNRCSCRKAGLHCSSSCKECHGVNCENVVEISNEEDDDNSYDRNFMDAFLD